MLAVWNSLSCGFVGAFAGHVAYVQSNLFVLGETTRRGRHLIWDPVAFAGLGGLFGCVVGAALAAWWAHAQPWKPIACGLAITVAAIAATGVVVTWQRDRALPRQPVLAGPAAELLFELRLPDGSAVSDALPRIEMQVGDPRPTVARCTAPTVGAVGLVVAGRVPLVSATESRLLAVLDAQGSWVNFLLPLKAQPGDADIAWTGWQSACNADARLPAEAGHQLRYRVQFAPAAGR